MSSPLTIVRRVKKVSSIDEKIILNISQVNKNEHSLRLINEKTVSCIIEIEIK